MIKFIDKNEEGSINDPNNHPSTAFVVVESKNGYMLLYNKFHKHWEITGGYMEKNETPEGCAIRECKEESNQNISNLKFIGIAKYTKMNAAIYYSYINSEETFIENNEMERMIWWKPNDKIEEKIDNESLKLIDLCKNITV